MNDSIDQSSDASMNEAETPVLDQSTATSSETQQVDTQDGAGVDAGTGSEDAQPEDPGSSTTPDTTSQTSKPTDQSAAPQRDWQAELAKAEKQAADWRAKHNQSSNQLHQYRQQYADVDPDAVRKYKAATAQAEKAQLPLWHKDNPRNSEFKNARSNFKMYKSAMSRAETPEERALAQKLLGPAFSQQDAESIKSYEAHQQQQLEKLADDFDGTVEEVVDRRVEMLFERKMQEREMNFEANQEVNGWMTAAENKPIVDKYGPQMLEALQQGNQWQFVRQMALDRAGLESLQSRVGTADKTSAHARAQSDLAKRKAVVSKDGNIKPQRDIAAEAMRMAKEKGWAPTDGRIIDLIEKLQQTNAI